ncbi:MAG: hypothetical protein WCO63_00375 [Bacteroidota bacterium]
MEKNKWYHRLLNIKQDELKPVLLLMIFSFFVGLSLSFYFTASNAIFLKHFPSKMISLSYMASGIVVYLAWLILSKIDRKLTVPQQLALKFIFVFITVLIISFWVWIYDTPLSAFVMFTWVRVLVYITLITFWGMAGKLFNIRQGKRVFGLIGIGEVISILIGYFSIPFILKVLKAKDLLFLSSGGLLICLFFAILILTSFKTQLSDQNLSGGKASVKSRVKDQNYFNLLKKPYFRLISVMAFLPIFGYLFVDFLFLDQTKHEFANNPEMISKFLGLFLGFTAFIELIFKFVSGRFLNRYGLKPSLIALPAILLFSITLAAFFGTLYGTLGLFFALVAFARLFERAIRGSIYEPAFQLLYQPVQEDQRLIFQNQIEGIPKALGTIITGGVIFLLASIKGLNLVYFNYFFILVLGAWIWVAVNMYTEYRSMIRAKLAGIRNDSHPQEEPGEEEITVTTGDTVSAQNNHFEELSTMAVSPDASLRLQAAQRLAFTGRYSAFKLLQILLNDTEPIIKKAALISSGRIKRFELWSSVIEHINSPEYGNTAAIATSYIGETILPAVDRYFTGLDGDKEVILRVIRIYREIGGELAISLLRRKINHPDKDIRYQILLALSELEYTAAAAEIPGIKQTIDEMAETMVWCIASWFEVDKTEGINQLQLALQQEINEKKESIFLLLSLIYDSNTIRHIRENIEGNDIKARMYALEVCDMTVSQDIKDLVLPLFDEIGQKEKLEKFNHRYPQQEFGLKGRLIDIINKDYGKINKWTKACAIEMMSVLEDTNDPEINQVLAANLVNPDLLIRETAACEIYRRSPARFSELLQNLEAGSRYPLKDVRSINQKLEKPRTLIIEKVRLLKKSPLLQMINEQTISSIALLWETLPTHPGTSFCLRQDSKDLLWIDQEILKEFLLGQKISLSMDDIHNMLVMNEDNKT